MSDPLARLTRLLARLPGVGEKSALRIALAIARSEAEYVQALSATLLDVSTNLRECETCCDLTSEARCSICQDARRDPSLVCVVSHPQDRMALERAGVFRGRYHVLHGVLDPLSGIGPNELRIAALIERLRPGDIKEVIVATSPSVEGDATALYLASLLRHVGVVVSRIASGIAVGGDIEYADMGTLHHALEHRRRLGE